MTSHYFSIADNYNYELNSSDNNFISFVSRLRIDLIVYAPHSTYQANAFLGFEPPVSRFIEISMIRVETLLFAKNMLNAKLIWKHEDTVFPYWQLVATAYSSVVDLYWVTDSDDLPVLRASGIIDRVLFLPAPVDSSVFYPRHKRQFFFFSGLIEGNSQRVHYIKAIKEFFSRVNLDSFVINDKAQSQLSYEEYTSLLGSSECSVNFCFQGTDVPTFPQLKHRPLEVLSSETLLFEQAGSLLSRFFKDREHFISFGEPDNLVDLIYLILNNTDFRAEIAKAGCRHASQFSKIQVWSQVLKRMAPNVAESLLQ